ncbi:MAG: LysR family transcriptional regulator [Actinomycetota bacterium]|nr:LysR family transcriptional regulator [Actinomycetota bacterium]
MTPTQLRAFSAVVRHGSVKDAAAELGVSESAVSIHVAQLRKELEDLLFTRTASGIAFTPGGLRLASRATEMLGLQDRTIREVSQAGSGRRLLRVAASSLFAEHAAPGLIELFAGRADDLDVELSERPVGQFETLLSTRAVDMTVGPKPRRLPDTVVHKPFLNYQIVAVVGPGHPLAGLTVRPAQLRDQTWLLGPSAVEREGAVSELIRRLDVQERHQQIYQSHSAALEEARRNKGVALAVSFAVAPDVASKRLVRLTGPGMQAEGVWTAMSLPAHSMPPAAAELMRFITTPRATQAMLRGAGVSIGHFRPSIHVTLWN